MPHGFEILLASLVCGLGLIGTGVGLAFCRSRAGKIKSLIGGLVFIFTVTGTFSIYALTFELIAASTLLVLAALIWFIRSHAASKIGHWLLRPRVTGVVTSVAGIGLIALCTQHFEIDRTAEDERYLSLLEQATTYHPPLEPAPTSCLTDAGTPVPVYSATEPRSRGVLAQDEKNILAGFDWDKRIIYRQPADDVSNCHGWVFTGGKYWVLGSDVMTIVEQNGYRAAPIPRPGDLVVYKRHDGSVTHTGIVRSVGAVTMVESKWGWMGVYLHAVESSCYGTNFTFYHNPTRSGHQFAQLNPSDAAPAARFTRTTGPNHRPELNR